MIFLSTIIGCILLMKENSAAGKLKKPVLEVNTRDPNDVVMIGDTVQINCINWTESNIKTTFYLTKDNEHNSTRKQATPHFNIPNLTRSDSGEYTCKYDQNGDFSEPSEPEYIYVKDKYPPPEITVAPRKIVRTGEDITITCGAPYRNIQYTIYKHFKPIAYGIDSPYSYIIRNAGQKDVGQYACDFRTTSSSKTQIQSDLSNPIMIQVKDFGSPSVSWKVNADDDKSVKITCGTTATTEQKKWFQLLNSTEDIEKEIMDVTEDQVIFNISIPDHTQKKYYCIYAVRIGQNFALSAMSKAIVIWDDDYTTMNIIRLLVSGLVLILLGVILVKHFEVSKEPEESPPQYLPLRRMQAAESEYSEMVIMKTEHVAEDSLNTAAPDNEISITGLEAEKL